MWRGLEKVRTELPEREITASKLRSSWLHVLECLWKERVRYRLKRPKGFDIMLLSRKDYENLLKSSRGTEEIKYLKELFAYILYGE